MSETFGKQLDDLLNQVTDPGPEPTEQPKQVETEHDALAHLIGSNDPDADRDPFQMILDGMLAGEGMDKESETPEFKMSSFEEHQWEFKAELVYEEDLVEAMCKKCCRHMKMSRDQSWNEAMSEHKVNPDCSQMLTQDICDA